ncbi:MAG: HAD-IIA family hydrolase [Christensenellales bacterium]
MIWLQQRNCSPTNTLRSENKVEDSLDYFGKDASKIRDMKLFLFDMDGTIYEEDQLFDGTLCLLENIVRNGGRYIFITNNSSRSVKDYIKKIKGMGIFADEENFFTSTQATIIHLKQHHPGSLIYCQGTAAMLNELSESGLSVTEEVSEKAGVILVGFDTELTFDKIKNTCKMLQREIPYYATNPDFACPVSHGFVPDCGAICMMLENATSRKPAFIGKPEPTMVNIVREKFGHTKDETVVIGDRLYTDIAAGTNAGVSTVCVLSGEATADDIVHGNIDPTYTFASVKEIASLFG